MRRAPFLALLIAAPAAAQDPSRSAAEWLDDCRRGRWGDDARACAVREVTLPRRSRLAVDGGRNGGVQVTGWDRDEIRVVARLQAQADREGDARAMLEDVRVGTDGTVRADGPRTDGDRGSWSVSYDVYVPRRTDLELQTENGGIRVRDVDGRVRFAARNGGVALTDLSGDVQGETRNGGVRVALAGGAWRGTGLDVRTQNGAVRVAVPSRYDAELEVGTVNGRFDIDFPMTVSGRIGRTLRTRLGAGGPPVRVTTTNGSVTVERRGAGDDR
ncbi:DUF4097 family beta strand repeat-containing protein [Roseisolibacter sp. H3M3-2]|uniref:DUF4097 family beta strand repeat-containing protein n=1 Tax=Roseisolibacter sp. H3M3-2 TaxID=3031323 RepID=UPI0023DA6269|nr:DUF4097 family beta strand repeat-containing protein [Roseisolibacter sp. H3M3-2]MDF1503766.1 hypothetical protein [Roseisolibacter sp. H3M3-2]